MSARRSAEVVAALGLFSGYVAVQAALLGVSAVAGRLRGSSCPKCGGYGSSSCDVCRGRS